MTNQKKTDDPQWPQLSYEELPWTIDYDSLTFISKTRRRKISSTYKAAIPLNIANRSLEIPEDLSLRLHDVSMLLVRFDEQQKERGYNLPALLLRSESSASSQIEHLTSSVRNVALAELAADAPQNARLIAGNVAAMRTALELPGPLDIDAIIMIHKTLMKNSSSGVAGSIRNEAVWVGGDSFSPHGAIFVPPKSSRVPALLDDLITFIKRCDLHPLVKAAVAHAQFETIHPFTDGNGRTGRALVHRILKDDEVLGSATLPVSAGLLHNVDDYIASITAYQQGNPLTIIEQICNALELAVALGEMMAKEFDEVFASWYECIHERRNAAIWKLPALLAEQPVVSAAYVAEKLGVTTRAASAIITRAQEYGILRPVGSGARSVYYQADELIEILEEISSR